MTRTSNLIGAVLLTATACEGPFELPPVHEGRTIRTDATRYTATRRAELIPPVVGYEFTLVATFFNPTAASLYLGRCSHDSPGPLYGITLVEPQDPEGAGYDPAWACGAHDEQFEIDPGESRVDTLRLQGPAGWDGVTKEGIGVVEGTFRLRYDVRTARGADAPRAADSLRVSNIFEVRIQG